MYVGKSRFLDGGPDDGGSARERRPGDHVSARENIR